MNYRQWAAVAALGVLATNVVVPDARGPTRVAVLAAWEQVTPGGHQPGPIRLVPLPKECRTLTDKQLAGLVISSGWPPTQRRTAFAVALAESSGQTCARGDVHLMRGDWGPSVCIWQMRSLNSQRGTGGMRDEAANLASPVTCGRHARQLWAQNGWTPWTTYSHGTYRRYLPRAARAGL